MFPDVIWGRTDRVAILSELLLISTLRVVKVEKIRKTDYAYLLLLDLEKRL